VSEFKLLSPVHLCSRGTGLKSARFTSSGHIVPERISPPVVHTIAIYHSSESVLDLFGKPAPPYIDTRSTTSIASAPTIPVKQPHRSLFKRIFGSRDTKTHQSKETVNTTVPRNIIQDRHVAETFAELEAGSPQNSPLSELHSENISFELYSPYSKLLESSAISPTDWSPRGVIQRL
jgi:hypothetical protein